MSPSAFAGNPLLLDLEALAQDGLLTQAELERARLPEQIDRVDYARLRACKLPLLELAWSRWTQPDWPDRPDWVAPWCHWAAERAV